MDRRFPIAGVAMALAVTLTGCKSVPEVPPGRNLGGNVPASATQVQGSGVGFSSAPPGNSGPSFAGGAPGSSTFRGSTAQSIPPNPWDLPPDAKAERAAAYEVPGLDTGVGSSERPASLLSPGNR